MKKPLIERFLTHFRVREEQALARIRSDPRLSRGQFATNFNFARVYGAMQTTAAERAIKYRLASSAQAMIDALRPRPLLREEMTVTLADDIAAGRRELDPDIETPILHTPSAPVWIELEEPIITFQKTIAGFQFVSADLEVERALAEPQPPARRAILEKARRDRGEQDIRWSLHFIEEDGAASTHYYYYEQSQAWAIMPDGPLPCPTGDCITDEDVSELSGLVEKFVLPCAFCETLMAYWRSWFVTALLVATGEFAETEAAEWPRHSERTTRKVARPNSKKYDEIPVEHSYYLVNFDASVKKVGNPANGTPLDNSEAKEEPTLRGSWVAAAQEIDPTAVVYVRKDFGTTERRLDPARNPRWKREQTVRVKGHSRRVPMRVATLQRKITRIIASKYQPKEADGDEASGAPQEE